MLPSESPFPCHWWGFGLEIAGLKDVRPDIGTYGRYEFDRLPPVPFEMRGDFTWLVSAPARRDSIGRRFAAETATSMKLLRASANQLGLPLPDPFTKFMETPALQERIRSNTDCYLDLCPELISSPIGGGWLVHFLADSQGCLFWYLYLTANGSNHAVVSSPDLYSTPYEEGEEWEDEEPNPAKIVFCAESFEAFLCRFWLENEIWFAAAKNAPMPPGGREYVEGYRAQK